MSASVLHCVHTVSALGEIEPEVKYHCRGCTSLNRLCLSIAYTQWLIVMGKQLKEKYSSMKFFYVMRYKMFFFHYRYIVTVDVSIMMHTSPNKASIWPATSGQRSRHIIIHVFGVCLFLCVIGSRSSCTLSLSVLKWTSQ